MNKRWDKTVGKDEWLTPREITQALGPFDLDPCAPIRRPWDTAKLHYTIADDGLKKPWCGYVWLNPPYGNETKKWLKRLAHHNNGISLTFARTETEMFFESVWPKATAVKFIQKRISFYEFACAICGRGQSVHSEDFEARNHAYVSDAPKVVVAESGNSGCSSILAAYGDAAATRLYACKVNGEPGKFILLQLKIGAELKTTWRHLIRFFMKNAGGVVSLDDLYGMIADHPKASTNPNWKAKARQIVQEEGKRIARGTYELALDY